LLGSESEDDNTMGTETDYLVLMGKERQKIQTSLNSEFQNEIPSFFLVG
jgi:hypothetical protein